MRAAIDEHYIARIRTGQSGSFDFAGGTYDLVIDRVYPEVIEGQFEADMVFPEGMPDGLRRGQTLQVRVALGELGRRHSGAPGRFLPEDRRALDLRAG